MDKQEEIRHWFRIAQNDFNVAEHVVNNLHPVPLEQACFLSQQSAEKDLKGFLVVSNIEPPKIHDLLSILDLCQTVDADFINLAGKCKFLNPFGVMPRYPNELQLMDDDARIAVQFAHEIKAFVKERMQ